MNIIANIPVLPMALLAVAIIIRYIIGRRRFNRMGIAGLQHFSSYGRAVFTTVLEKLFLLLSKLILIAAVILFLLHLLK